MMHRLFLLLPVVLLIAPISKLQGQTRDKVWAECVWKRAPQTAAAWLKAKPPTWQDNMQTTSELLGFRMIALCDTAAFDVTKPNRLPGWRSIRTILTQARPRQMVQAGAGDMKALLCESFAVKADERHLYRADVYRQTQAGRTLLFRQFFGSTGDALRVNDRRGRMVTFQLAGVPDPQARIRMPQDLVTSPIEGYASEEFCREIAPDGSLTNA